MFASVSWDEFRLVKAIADGQSLVAAAAQLGLNHSTLFRRLGQLEKDLGVRLFDRGRTGYTATPAGQEMIALANRMAADIVAFERKVAGRDGAPVGQLRVTTNDTLLMHLLVPLLAGFRTTYPDIQLELLISNEALNLANRDADIAIRATDTPPDTLVGRRIARFAFAVYAPRHLGLDPNATLDETQHRWVGYAGGLKALPAARWMEAHVPEDRVVYRSNTMLGQAEAVAAGLGLSVLPCFIAEQRADLTRLGAPIATLDHSLWLLTHPDLRQTARVRAFMDYAAQDLAKRRHVCEGKAPNDQGMSPILETGEIPAQPVA